MAFQRGVFHSPWLRNQQGVIVDLRGDNGKKIVAYSPVSGRTLFCPKLLKRNMTLGSFVSYGAELQQEVWHTENVQYIDQHLEVVPNLLRKTVLQLRVLAEIHRVDPKTRAAWLWNDDIGRIHVPPIYFRDSLQSFGAVTITAMYHGEHEDVPWRAVHVRESPEQTTAQVARDLHTTDGWTVTEVGMRREENDKGFFCVLTNSREESVFAAWTDFLEGEEAPAIGTVCRVTYFHQKRFRKYYLRAVAVSPLSTNGKTATYHPLIRTARTPMTAPTRGVMYDRYGTACGSLYSNDNDSTMSMSSAQSEMEEMVDASRVDDFRMRSDSDASSLHSSSSQYEYMPIFNGPQFDAWHPTEEEDQSPH